MENLMVPSLSLDIALSPHGILCSKESVRWVKLVVQARISHLEHFVVAHRDMVGDYYAYS